MGLENDKPINIALLGCGVVGSEVAIGIEQGRLAQSGIRLKTVLIRDLSKPRPEIGSSTTFTDNPNNVFADDEIDIYVEVMGGVDPSLNYIQKALHKGKAVVTANKEVLGEHLPDLYDLARVSSASLSYEASVCGTIPVMHTLRDYYRPQNITGVKGILNGTTNYILTRMSEGTDFDPALYAAKAKGFAEADPKKDLDGSDACSKLAILTTVATGVHIRPQNILKRGIYGLTQDDIAFANTYGVENGGKGYAVKLLGSAEQHDGTWSMQIAPTLISRNHPLASVDEATNAVTIESDLSRSVTYIGPGAGGEPTAAAILADIQHAAEHVRYKIPDYLPQIAKHVATTDPRDIESMGYIRVWLLDKVRTYARIADILANNGLSMRSILQRGEDAKVINGKEYTQDFITLHQNSETRIDNALKQLTRSNKVHGQPFYMRFAA